MQLTAVIVVLGIFALLDTYLASDPGNSAADNTKNIEAMNSWFINEVINNMEQEKDQSKKIKDHEDRLTDHDERLKKLETITDSLERKAQVAFTVRYEDGSNVIHVGKGGTLKYPFVVTNIGDGYDPEFGTFTAPYGGTYAFYAHLRSSDKHGSITLSIMKNDNVKLITLTAEGDNDPNDKGVGFATTRLATNDTVRVQQSAGSSFLMGNELTNFSGMLLVAD